MFKQISLLEVKAGDDRFHRYECPSNSPLGEIYDSLSSMRNHVFGLMKLQEEKEKEEKEKEEKDPLGLKRKQEVKA